MTHDYRASVFLPQTAFPMKAGLAQSEPKWLELWRTTNLYGALREARAGAEKFILHDGPPYANGDIHIGHALNKILKDVVVRTQSMLGKDAPYVPGWDCHGLPIEWKIEEQYRKKGRNKDEVDPNAFRAECRAYAQHWVGVQSEQFQRLGVLGAWDKPYLTMDYQAEATIVAELLKFAETRQLYRGAKPVMWSPVEKTALAEAEVEYQDVVSTQIDVAFKITHCPRRPDLVGAYAVIWTTTPWTIPTNRAIAYGEEVEYVEVRLLPNTTLIGEGNLEQKQSLHPLDGKTGLRIVVAKALADELRKRINSSLPKDFTVGWLGNNRTGTQFFEEFVGADLEGALAEHPWARFEPSPLEGEGGAAAPGEGSSATPPTPSLPLKGGGSNALSDFFRQPRPFLPGDFVTTDQGTGLVHMAPDHGEDDFWLCKAHGIDPVFVVQPDGSYRADWPVVGGNHVYKVNAKDGPVCSALSEAGALLSAADFHHSYPHSWRSKAKLIFRCTPQWFVAMDGALPSPSRGEGVSLRQTALGAIEATRFVPPSGQNRIRAMVEGRPDWVLSRQRAWGVPITLFVHRQSGDYLRDPAVNARIRAAIAEKGVDAWYDTPAEDFIGNAANAADYEKVTDILDVWFDSGSTHAFVLESGVWPELASPADLYLEGSDQHRGWFQSSLLESCGTRGRAPYKAVLTHGFTLDGQGRKMSKSLGNTIDPLTVIKENGADILRLWVVSTNFVEDQRIGKEILAGTVDAYRKLRNTLRYLLGALEGFSEAERLDLDDSAVVACLPELERWMLGRIHSLDALVRQATNDFDFNRLYTALFQFCTVDLSALYVDIRKDSLYCDGVMSNRRRACRSVLDRLFHHLTLWLAPILAFTAEEAWQTRFPGPSVHLGVWPAVPACWADEALAARWARVLELRLVVTGALEVERREKRIGSSLQAAPVLHASAEDAALLAGLDMAEVCITSALTISTEPAPDSAFRLADVPGVAVVPLLATAEKCARCWQHLPEVGSHAEHPELCNRCHDVVTAA